MFNEKFEEVLNGFIQDLFDNRPAIAAYMGKEEYEKKTANGTPENYLAFVSDVKEYLSRLNEIDDTQLKPENHILFKVLKDTLILLIFLHENFPDWNRYPYGLNDIQLIMFALLQRKGPTKTVAEAVIAQLEQLPQFLEEFRLRFDGSPIPKVWQETSYEMIKNTPQFFGYLEIIFQSSLDENLKQSFSMAISKATTAVEDHTLWIQALPVDEDEFSWALGQANFDKLLSLRKLPWDREKILKSGYELLESLTKQAHQLANLIDSTKTFEEVVDEVKAHHPPNFEMVLEHAGNEAKRAKEFILTHDLASIPPEDNLVIAETPQYIAPLIPIAMYGPPPFYAHSQSGIYYITRPSSESSLKTSGFHSYYSIPNVMVHEAYPGHHLDFCWNNQLSSPLTTIAPLASTLGIETVEGWAHYCEEMMLEQGFHDELSRDKVKLTILVGQIWRAARIIVDIELHCKIRTVEDAIKLLIDRALMEAPTAKAEVRRYTTAPGYQLSYLIGKLLIQQLRQEVEIKQGDQFNLKDFHDTILKSGDLPYYLLKELFKV